MKNEELKMAVSHQLENTNTYNNSQKEDIYIQIYTKLKYHHNEIIDKHQFSRSTAFAIRWM